MPSVCLINTLEPLSYLYIDLVIVLAIRLDLAAKCILFLFSLLF